jgi:hypothetical protein
MISLPSADAQARQHRLRDLVLAHHHLGRAVLPEMLGFLLGVGARDDRQRRIDPAGFLDDLSSLERIGDGNQQAARGRQIGGARAQIASIAVVRTRPCRRP